MNAACLSWRAINHTEFISNIEVSLAKISNAVHFEQLRTTQIFSIDPRMYNNYLFQVYGRYQNAYSFMMGNSSDYDSSEIRLNKRQRMSNNSALEPPSSAVSYSSFSDFSNILSVMSHSQRSSLKFSSNHNSFNYNLMCDSSSALWHSPMLPSDNFPYSFIHPLMLLQNSGEDSVMSLHCENSVF